MDKNAVFEEIEIAILWNIFSEKEKLFSKRSFDAFRHFFLGVGFSLTESLSYNMAWHGCFQNFVCHELKVFNWDDIEKETNNNDIQDIQEFSRKVIKNAKQCQYVVKNWLDAVADNRSDSDAFDYFFELLLKFHPDYCVKGEKHRILLRKEGIKMELPDILLHNRNCLSKLIGPVNPSSLLLFIQGFLWGEHIISPEQSTIMKRFNEWFTEYKVILITDSISNTVRESEERVESFLVELQRWYQCSCQSLF